MHCLIEPQRYQHYYSHSFRKTGLANASVVCRYWGEVTRPALWTRLNIRSPEDVRELLRMVRSRPEVCAHTKKIIYLKKDNHIPPWIPLHTLLKYFPPQTKLGLQIGTHPNRDDDYDPHNAVDGSTLLRCFPRTLPRSVMPYVTELHASCTTFQRVGDIWKLLHAFPDASEDTQFIEIQFKRPILVPPMVNPLFTRLNHKPYWRQSLQWNDGLNTVPDDILRTIYIFQPMLMMSENTFQSVLKVLCALSVQENSITLTIEGRWIPGEFRM